jgi:hypothetical protein
MTWTSPKAPTMMLCGFRSRWITPPAVDKADCLADLGERLEQPGAVGGFQLDGQGVPGDKFHG